MHKPHQTTIGKTVVNITTIERWAKDAEIAALLRPFRNETTRARNKKRARRENRKLKNIARMFQIEKLIDRAAEHDVFIEVNLFTEPSFIEINLSSQDSDVSRSYRLDQLKAKDTEYLLGEIDEMVDELHELLSEDDDDEADED